MRNLGRLLSFYWNISVTFSEPFDTASWMLVGIVAIHAATIMILFFEWLSPSGFNMKVNPSGAARRLVLLISLLITCVWCFLFHLPAPIPHWTNYSLDNVVDHNDISHSDTVAEKSDRLQKDSVPFYCLLCTLTLAVSFRCFHLGRNILSHCRMNFLDWKTFPLNLISVNCVAWNATTETFAWWFYQFYSTQFNVSWVLHIETTTIPLYLLKSYFNV